MVKIETSSSQARSLKGLHLYHAHASNCSARVRLVLEEKGLPWASHHILLSKMENITEEYFAINPKGIVPTLVHNGDVITESNDILVYVEEQFPEVSFRDVEPDKQPEIDRWLKLSADTHMTGIKTYQFHRAKTAGMVRTKEKIDLYRKLQTDQKHIDFHGKNDTSGFSDEDADNAKKVMNEVFEEMEVILGSGDWLVDNTYTLADISWVPTVTNLIASEYDFAPYPNLVAWHDRAARRPAYKSAVADWRARRFD